MADAVGSERALRRTLDGLSWEVHPMPDTDLLDSLDLGPDAADRLRAAARRIDDLRFAAQEKK